jgi:hypothetical protein
VGDARVQPDAGHEVLWVVRDCLSGEVILARSLQAATAADLVPLLREAAEAVGVPVLGVVSDGQAPVGWPSPRPCRACRTSSATSTS